MRGVSKAYAGGRLRIYMAKAVCIGALQTALMANANLGFATLRCQSNVPCHVNASEWRLGCITN